MTLKKLFFWFWTTLAIGAGSVFLFTPFINTVNYSQQLLIGLTLAAVTELGFFSYLVFHWLCRGLVRSQKMFHLLLTGLLVIVLINFTYLCVHQPLPYYPILLSIILGIAISVSYLKSRWTQWSAFIPTAFFMITATILEATPSFQSKLGPIPFNVMIQTVSVILICNAWQILQLHRWTKK